MTIGIAIYDDRVEIENPGRLPNQLTIDSIKLPHPSFPYNLQIARVLYMSTFLESWGSGVKRMVDLCVADGLPEPEYRQRFGFVTVNFKKRKEVDEEKIKQIITDKLSINDKIVDKLSINRGAIDKMVAIMLFLEEHPHSTTGNLVEITQQSASRTKNYVQALVEMNLLIAEGGNKNRTYTAQKMSH